MIKRVIFLSPLVSIIFFTFTILSAEQVSDFSVPLPAGEKPVDSHSLLLNQRQINCLLYLSDKSALEISQFYHNFFEQQGFRKILDTDAGNKKLLRFKKDDLVISFALTPQGTQTQMVIAKYLEPKGAPPMDELKLSVKDSPMAMPKEDQPGRDFKFIPRPPQSVRWGELEAGGNINLMYGSPAAVSELINFYKAKMSDNGWQIKNEQAAAGAVASYKQGRENQDLGLELPIAGAENIEDVLRDTYILSFSGLAGEATITIMPNYLGRKYGSLVEISYQKSE